MTNDEIRAAVRNLPELPDVVAVDMLRSQAYKPAKSEMAAIKARADFFEAVGMTRTVNINVRDFNGALLGHLSYRG